MNKPKWWKIAGLNKVNIDLDKLRSDYDSKIPVAQIAGEYGVTVQTVYSRLRQLGITRSNSEAHIGQTPWNKADGHIDSMGYRVICIKGKQIREHRVVAEQMLGRKLEKGEVVHHLNGNRSDNRPENLEVHKSHSEHMKHHLTSDSARSMGAKGLKSRYSALKACGVEVESPK